MDGNNDGNKIWQHKLQISLYNMMDFNLMKWQHMVIFRCGKLILILWFVWMSSNRQIKFHMEFFTDTVYEIP